MSASVIYTLGYTPIRNMAHLYTVIHYERWKLVDTRINPFSFKPIWSISSLKKLYGEHYCHIPQFGNVLYNRGAIEIADMQRGIERVAPLLRAGVSIVLLCTCADVTTCHRTVVAAELSEATGCRIDHLTADDINQMALALGVLE